MSCVKKDDKLEVVLVIKSELLDRLRGVGVVISQV